MSFELTCGEGMGDGQTLPPTPCGTPETTSVKQPFHFSLRQQGLATEPFYLSLRQHGLCGQFLNGQFNSSSDSRGYIAISFLPKAARVIQPFYFSQDCKGTFSSSATHQKPLAQPTPIGPEAVIGYEAGPLVLAPACQQQQKMTPVPFCRHQPSP